ncbi:uncharacterized protein AMSG_03905 [Thecamonas trahens ATCC 50062]|uniref:CENP-T/Histone H4 histone fold domain-containing protein n=1 Tax=Thecamonas trahens ATCC 50062 TaxID=461836 RepID=A0A0L0D5P9_THETB|nr:hypothetical protein AMSG_03905 [Thecamonas trahens ATCC 50062]KNC47674.1 hypothetical protein AMSG_03905 [Thecamonas trahens ATCC 50062]|eukprot:XP_013759158.1 hypothetical protein AMSG_03905 [Thecamonas trahens ATCC 50062]
MGGSASRRASSVAVKGGDTPRTMLVKTAMALAMPSPASGGGSASATGASENLPPRQNGAPSSGPYTSIRSLPAMNRAHNGGITPRSLLVRTAEALLASGGSDGAPAPVASSAPFVAPMLAGKVGAIRPRPAVNATPKSLLQMVAMTATPGEDLTPSRKRSLTAPSDAGAAKKPRTLAAGADLVAAEFDDDAGWEDHTAYQAAGDVLGDSPEPPLRPASAVPARVRPRAGDRPEGMPFTPPRPLTPVDVTKGKTPAFAKHRPSAPQVPVRATGLRVARRNKADAASRSAVEELMADLGIGLPPKTPAPRAASGKPLPSLPRTTIKVLFERYLGSTIDQAAAKTLLAGSYEYLEQLAEGLNAYGSHSGNGASVKLREERVKNMLIAQGLAPSHDAINDLIREYLPLEMAEQLIPVARATPGSLDDV